MELDFGGISCGITATLEKQMLSMSINSDGRIGRRDSSDGRRESWDKRRDSSDGRRESWDGRRDSSDGRRESWDGRSGSQTVEAPLILSPSSAFAVSKLPIVKKNLIHSVMFSLWDNVLGPKIDHVWTNDDITATLTRTLMHISSHSLNGEICRDADDPSIDTKFYHMQDRGFVVTAFVFTAQCRGAPAVHSLNVIVPLHHVSTFLPYYDLCTAYLTRCLACLRVQLSVGSLLSVDALEDFSLKVQSLVELFNSLSVSGVPTTIRLSDTYFHLKPVDVSGAFLKRVVASHLMTCGHTVVVGRTMADINPLISTLCLFSTVKDRSCSRYVRDDQGWPYEPQLAVQGLILRGNCSPSIRINDILSGPHPSTIVDLTTGEVVQSPPCHEHVLNRHEMLKTELACVLDNSSPVVGIYPTSPLLLTVDPTETYVTTLFNELSDASTELKAQFIDQFLRSLERRALLLIKYVEACSRHGEYMKVGVEKMRRNLDLKVEGDFRMVLATAERLKEGIYGFVLGDPKLEREQFLLDSI